MKLTPTLVIPLTIQESESKLWKMVRWSHFEGWLRHSVLFAERRTVKEIWAFTVLFDERGIIFFEVYRTKLTHNLAIALTYQGLESKLFMKSGRMKSFWEMITKFGPFRQTTHRYGNMSLHSSHCWTRHHFSRSSLREAHAYRGDSSYNSRTRIEVIHKKWSDKVILRDDYEIRSFSPNDAPLRKYEPT